MSSFSRASDGTTSSAPAESCLLHLHVSLSSGPYLSDEPVQQPLCRRSASRQSYRTMSEHGRSNQQSMPNATPPGAALRPALERRARSLCCSLHFHYTPPLY